MLRNKYVNDVSYFTWLIAFKFQVFFIWNCLILIRNNATLKKYNLISAFDV